VKRTESTIRDRLTGQIYKTTKGAPHVIIRLIASNYHTHSSHAVDTVPAIIGSANLDDHNGISNSDSIYSDKSSAGLIAAIENDIKSLGERGIRTLAVAKTSTESGEWIFLGLLTFLDPPRPDTLQTIEDARRYGVAVKMITGLDVVRSLVSVVQALMYTGLVSCLV
jgi:H+-transporting ATPase